MKIIVAIVILSIIFGCAVSKNSRLGNIASNGGGKQYGRYGQRRSGNA